MIRIHELIVGRISSSGGSDAWCDKYAIDGCAIVILVICFRWDRRFVDAQYGFPQSQIHQHFADGAFADGKRLAVRPCASLEDAVLYSTTPDMFYKPGEMDAFQRVESAVKLRRFGGDCYAYAMLAAGHVDLIVESAMQAYDIQALIPIVEGAGGIVTDWQGNSVLDGGQIVYQTLEWIKGSPLSERAQILGQQFGILALILLMSFAFYNDIARILG